MTFERSFGVEEEEEVEEYFEICDDNFWVERKSEFVKNCFLFVLVGWNAFIILMKLYAVKAD